MATGYADIIEALKTELQKGDLSGIIDELKAKQDWREGRDIGFVGSLVIPQTVCALCRAAEADEQLHCEALKSARGAAEALLDNAKNAALRARETRVKGAQAEHESADLDLSNKIGNLNRTIKDLQSKREKEEGKFSELGFLEKRFERSVYEERFKEIDAEIDRQMRLLDSLEKSRTTGEAACDEEGRASDASYESAVADANRSYQKAVETLELLTQNRIDEEAEELRVAMGGLVSDGQLNELSAHCASIRPSYERFHPLSAASFDKPGDFYVGLISVVDEIANPERRLNGLHEGVFEIERQSDGKGRYRVELPFNIDLSQGLQMVINPKGSGNEWVNEAIRLFTIRLLMAYPAGKLQLTLIDPLRNGLSFAGVTSIVDRDHDHLIGGGVLTQGRFIESGLSALQLKMAGFSQSYGKDREAYFKREPIQAVIINDFPNGFSQSSLENLAKIMKNGRDFGTLFIIGVNDSYSSDFANDSNYRAIMSEIDAYHNDLMLVGSAESLEFKDIPAMLTIGDGQVVSENEKAILAEIRQGIQHSTSRKESFDQLFDDLHNPNTWRRRSSIDGVDIPIGVEGAGHVVNISVGRPGTAHHGLVTGSTGSGKSTALHAMIMSTIINYSPDEVRFVLIDFKEGTEFRDYALYQIPSFLSITTTTEPEYALAALKDLEDEFERRTSLFDHGDIKEFRQRNPEAEAPRIILLFDEVQALFADNVREDVRNACLAILRTLVTQGRSVGLHVFLASQNFERVPVLRPLMSDMQVRLCIKDTDTGGILESAEALRDAPVGSAILNNGGGTLAAGQTLFQVCYQEDEERHELLTQLADIHSDDEMRERYRDYETRLLFTDIMDNRFHPFNRFIDDGEIRPSGNVPRLHLGSCLKLTGGENPYSLTGLDFAIDLMGNLLLVGNNADIATSICISIVLSGVLDVLAAHSSSDRIEVYDFTEGDMFVSMAAQHTSSRHASLSDLCATMPEAVHRIETSAGFDGAPYLDRISELYSWLQERMGGNPSESEPASRIISVLYGIDSALALADDGASENDPSGDIGPLAKLQALLKDGPRYGMYFIVWGQSLAAIEEVLSFDSAGTMKNCFGYRAIFAASQDEFRELGMCMELPATKQGAYFFSQRGRAYFRPFDPPTSVWVQEFGNAFADEWMERK